MNHYITIGILRELLVQHYHRYKEKLSFDQALNEAIIKKLCISTVSFLPARTNSLLNTSDFVHMINEMPVSAETILNNPQKSIISEEYMIPTNQDVETVCHLPYVNDHLHKHNHFEINYVYSGKAFLEANETTYVLESNELCIIPPELFHNLIVQDDTSIVIGIMVRKSTFDSIFSNILAMNDLLANYFKNILYRNENHRCLRFHLDSKDEIFFKTIQNIVIETHSDERYSNVIANCLVQEMFFLLLRKYSNTAKYFDNDEIMMEQNYFLMILEYTQKHYDTVSLKFLSEFFNYSESYLSRLFKKNMNTNFSTLLMDIRLKKAEELLRNTDLSIFQISEAIGYSSVDYFTKAFKKQYRLTPSLYRKTSL